MARLKLTLAYVGTHFVGWQVQPQGRTVQGVLEETLAKLCQAPATVHSAGRTDSGVHALAQVAHVDVPDDRAGLPWRKALNATLPEDVCVTSAEWVDDGFHARYSASGKIYAYHLWTEYEYVLPQRRPFVWRLANADLERMDQAAVLFTGTHDFASFQNAGTPLASTVRTLERIWRSPGAFPEEQVYRLQGDGFLKQMVRNIMGCLAEVGRGKLGLQDVQDLLQAKDRTLAPATAPACGLTLERVLYDGPPHPPIQAADNEE